MRREEAAPDREDDDEDAPDAKEEGERVRKRAEALSQANYQACVDRTCEFMRLNGTPADEEVSIPY